MSDTGPELAGRSIIAGRFAPAPETAAHAFRSFNPNTGEDIDPPFHPATDEQVDAACLAAWEAFGDFAATAPVRRAHLLETIATNLRDLGEHLVSTCMAETGLGEARVLAERERTAGTLRLLADAAREGRWVEAIIDRGDPARRPEPGPDLRRVLMPMGPVAVFGASNFPLAYSVAGGDTGSALAAGCPVIVKGHPSHPATGELVARAVRDAVAACGLPPGTFSYLVAGGPREHAIGSMLVRNPCVRAVGFTGSFAGGTALSKLAAERPDPIPVYAEMGSVNPVVVLPRAMEARGEQIAQHLAASITASCGQQCTCPGLIFMRSGSASERFSRDLANRLGAVGPQTMLSPRIRHGLLGRMDRIKSLRGVDTIEGAGELSRRDEGGPVRCGPMLVRCTGAVLREHEDLREELFGPAAVLVTAADTTDLLRALALIQGSLTGTIWAEPEDADDSRRVHTLLEQRVGRLIYNGVPTGVEVTGAMVHGGPYPACTEPGSSAQGFTALRRWCRPICYQNTPDERLPPALRAGNPLGIERLVDGRPTTDPAPRR